MEDQVNANTTRANELQLEVVSLRAQLTQLGIDRGQERRNAETEKAFRSALNHLPRYDGKQCSFREHLERFHDWVSIEGIQ